MTAAPAYPLEQQGVRAAKPVRQDWVDLLRGIGIILVVLGHALGGLIDTRGVAEPAWFRPAFAAIYIFHMPLFFLLAGVFVARRLDRGRGAFIRKLGPSILWPYILWSSLQILIIWMAAGLVNNPGSGPGVIVPALLYSPPSQFWFLYGLGLMSIAVALAPGRPGDAAVLVPALALGSLGEVHGLPGLPKAILLGVPWYAIGVVFGERLLQAGQTVRRLAPWHLAVIAATPIGIVLALWDATHLERPAGWRDTAAAMAFQVNGFRKFYAAALAIAALTLLAMRFQHAAPKWLLWCGQRSMGIFVVHVIAIAGTRIALLSALGPIDPTVLLAVLTLVGLAAPLILYAVAQRVGATTILGLG